MTEVFIGPPDSKRFAESIKEGRHQEAWDYLLCWSWLVRGDHKARSLRFVFERAGGNPEGLRRCPEFTYGTTRVFVGNYLKWLSDRLWDRFYPAWDEPSLWRLVDVLGRSALDCEQSSQSRREAYERRRTKLENSASLGEKIASDEYRESTNRAKNHGARRAGYR